MAPIELNCDGAPATPRLRLSPSFLTALRLAAFVLTGPGAALAQMASFDCAKAELDAEKAICAAPALGAKDVRMATLYHVLTSVEPAWGGMAYREFRDNQRDLQAAWAAKIRNPCGADIECLSRAYDERAQELSSSVAKSLGLTFGRKCDGG